MLKDSHARPWLERDVVALPHPERRDRQVSRFELALSRYYGDWLQPLFSERWTLQRSVRAINRLGKSYAEFDDTQLLQAAQSLRPQLLRRGFVAPLVAQAFALTREVSARKLGMRHYDVQLMGGLAMLHGFLAEMETGEGKTLTALLPAVTAALAGMPVHIVTVNDYLASRDADGLRPVY